MKKSLILGLFLAISASAPQVNATLTESLWNNRKAILQGLCATSFIVRQTGASKLVANATKKAPKAVKTFFNECKKLWKKSGKGISRVLDITGKAVANAAYTTLNNADIILLLGATFLM